MTKEAIMSDVPEDWELICGLEVHAGPPHVKPLADLSSVPSFLDPWVRK